MTKRHEELQAKIENQAIAASLEKKINRRLKLGTKLVSSEECSVLKVFGPTDEDIRWIQRELSFREGSVRVGQTVDKAADMVVSSFDSAGRYVVVPVTKKFFEMGLGAAAATGKTLVSALAGGFNAGRKTYQKTRQSMKEDTEINDCLGTFRKKEPVNSDRFLIK